MGGARALEPVAGEAGADVRDVLTCVLQRLEVMLQTNAHLVPKRIPMVARGKADLRPQITFTKRPPHDLVTRRSTKSKRQHEQILKFAVFFAIHKRAS